MYKPTSCADKLREVLAGEVRLGVEVLDPRVHVLQRYFPALITLREWRRKAR
jgi:hypothetical protein